MASSNSNETFCRIYIISNCNSGVFSHFDRKVSGLLAGNFWKCCQDCISIYLSRRFFRRKISSKKVQFEISLGLRTTKPDFWQIFFIKLLKDEFNLSRGSFEEWNIWKNVQFLTVHSTKQFRKSSNAFCGVFKTEINLSGFFETLW